MLGDFKKVLTGEKREVGDERMGEGLDIAGRDEEKVNITEGEERRRRYAGEKKRGVRNDGE